MSTGPEYDPAKTTHAQLVERKAAPGNVIQLYHGTDAESAQKIKAEHPKLIGAPFHDFAIGRNSAFYLTTSHETAVAFAKERANALGGGTKAAVVTVTVHRDKVKIYEFDAVDPWQKFVDYNRAKPRPKDKPQHELVRTHDIVAGWISTQTKTRECPLCLESSMDSQNDVE
ncbi:hypothetical protein VTO73DRAFT_5734 [Trametes versicolor]